MMKAFFFIVSIVVINNTYAQVNPRPTSSRFLHNNKASFKLSAGDLLFYEVNEKGVIKTITANVIKVGDGLSVVLNGTRLRGWPKDLLLTKRNYDSIARGNQIIITYLDSSSRLLKPVGTFTQKIIFKGREVIFTTHKANTNYNSVVGNISIMTDPKNPLITKVSSSLDITLKEVR